MTLKLDRVSDGTQTVGGVDRNVYFADRNGYLEIVTDTFYYWRYIGP